MQLNKLYPHKKNLNNHVITAIIDDSREATPGCVFYLRSNNTANAQKYYQEAVNRGAKTIVYTLKLRFDTNEQINNIKVSDIDDEIARVCQLYFKRMLAKRSMIGITGTNGKTTTSTILFNYFQFLHKPVLLIGSNGIYWQDHFQSTANTTPRLLEIMHAIARSNAKYVIIEISSQAIVLKRLLNIYFDIVAITNITTDHLDFHHTLKGYVLAKMQLLKMIKKRGLAILPCEDANWPVIREHIQSKFITYGMKQGLVQGVYIQGDLAGSEYQLQINRQKHNYTTNLLGTMNVANLTLVIGILKAMKLFRWLAWRRFSSKKLVIKGRLQVTLYQNRTFVIDYAHTSQAVLQTLYFLRDNAAERLHVVIGAGGERDRQKRPIIGKTASELADFVYFTEDNSRNEDLDQILNDLTANVTTSNYQIIKDREEAIHTAIKQSMPGDVIAIIGKGIEKSRRSDGTIYTDFDCIKEFEVVSNEN